MTFGSWVGAGALGLVLCAIMWFYGRMQYKNGWNDGFHENLKIKLENIKDGLASRIEVYHVSEYEEDDEE